MPQVARLGTTGGVTFWNTISVVEVKGSGISWAQPEDLDLSLPQQLPPGNHRGSNLVLFGDGSVRVLGSVSPMQIRAMATIAGNEVINK